MKILRQKIRQVTLWACCVVIVVVIGSSYFGSDSDNISGKERKRVVRDDRDSKKIPDSINSSEKISFRDSHGIVDYAKLSRSCIEVNSRNFFDFFSEILGSELSESEKSRFLFDISCRMVRAGNGNLVSESIDKLQIRGALKAKLLMAVYQDPTVSIPTLLEWKNKLEFQDEAKAALAGISQKMRYPDFDASQLKLIEKLSRDEALAITNGLVMKFGDVESSGEIREAFLMGHATVKAMIASGVMQPDSELNYLIGSSHHAPMEAWDEFCRTDSRRVSPEVWVSGMRFAVKELIKSEGARGMDVVAASYGSGVVEDRVYSEAVRQWISTDAEKAVDWFGRQSPDFKGSDSFCLEMYWSCLRSGDESVAKMWKDKIRNQELLARGSDAGSDKKIR